MNKLSVFLLTAILSVGTFGASIAKVDVQKVLLSVDEGKAVRSTLKKKFESKQKIIKAEEEKIRKMQTDYQKQSELLSPKAKLKKERVIQAKIMELQQKTMGFQKDIQDQENKLKKPILEKVRTVIEKISKESNYDMVFEVSTSPIYVKEVSDITDKVVKAYNKSK